MNDKEKLEIWKRKFVELEEKVRKLKNDKNVLINLLNEIKIKQNIKLDILLKGIELEEEISYLKDWIEFYNKKILGYKNKIVPLGKIVSEQEFENIREEAKLKELLEGKEEAKREHEEEKEPEFKFEEREAIKVAEKLEKKVILEKGSREELFKFISAEVEKEPGREEIKKVIKVETWEKDGPEVKEGVKEPEKLKIKIEEKQPVRKEVVEIKELLEKKEEKPEIEAKEELKEQIKELFREKEAIKKPKFKEKLKVIKKPIENIFEGITKLSKNKLITYGAPIILMLLIISVLFVSKPQITGHVVLTQEKTYEDNLNLIINESGNYTWAIDKTGDIKSIKATGRVKGNGTVKIYIEKDGKRYMVFDSKNK